MTATDPLYDAALAAYREGDLAACADHALAVLAREPDHGPALLLRAVSCDKDDLALAFACYGASCRNAPHSADSWFNRGVAAEEAGLRPLAIDCYRRALAFEPMHHGALLNGTQLIRVHEHFAEALKLARRLQHLDPDNAMGYTHEAISLIYLGDLEGSDRAFAKALARTPDPGLLNWEHHFSLLARRKFALAWEKYEYRFACGDVVGVEDSVFDRPRWTGAPDQHVLVYGEQGLGDQIMFASALGDLARDCRKVSLAVSPPLAPLFAASFPDMHVAPLGDGNDAALCAAVLRRAGKGGRVDAVLPIGSLMTRYRNQAGDFDGRPFLAPSPAAREFWKGALGSSRRAATRPLRVGLCWASNPAPHRFFSARRAAHKTMPLDAMAPLVTGTAGIEAFAVTNVPLEAFPGDPALKRRIRDVSADLVDLDRTAALLQSLDLLITVDTGVAHLAGALGVPVWILLHAQGDARWGQNGDTASYWYDSARLYWQREQGDWPELVARVSADLAALAGAGALEATA